MNHMPPRPHTTLARSVNRALGDIRRGVPVCIISSGAVFVAVAVETATAGTLAEFAASSLGQASLILAQSRAADLGLAVSGAPSAVAVRMRPGDLDPAALRVLADPTLFQTHPARPDAVPAGSEAEDAALMLAKLARLLPAVLLAPAQPIGGDLLQVAAADVLAYPDLVAETLQRAASARVPLEEADDVRIVAYRPPDGGIEHSAILIGDPEAAETPLVRIHSECFTGDLLGSRRCDCGPQLHQAMRRMEAEGAGVILYMAQEGRGIGLVNKLRAYTLQDGVGGRPGLDTLDANRALGYGADERSFAAAATMLRDLGIGRVRLLTNNPAKLAGLASHGIEVAGRISHAIAANGENDAYLETKARRFGHLLG